MHAHPRPLIFLNNLWGSVRGSLELLRIRTCSPHICDSDTLPPTWPGQLNSRAITCRPTWLIADTVGGLGRSYGRLCNRYYTDVHVQTSMAGRNTLARHVWHLWSRSPRPDARAATRSTCWWADFQPPHREQNVQFRRFLYCVHDSVCNTIRSPCYETWTNAQQRKFNQRLWTLLFGLHVRCGAFIQCGGGDRSAGGSVPSPSQLDRARTRFSTKIGSITIQ